MIKEEKEDISIDSDFIHTFSLLAKQLYFAFGKKNKLLTETKVINYLSKVIIGNDIIKCRKL